MQENVEFWSVPTASADTAMCIVRALSGEEPPRPLLDPLGVAGVNHRVADNRPIAGQKGDTGNI